MILDYYFSNEENEETKEWRRKSKLEKSLINLGAAAIISILGNAAGGFVLQNSVSVREKADDLSDNVKITQLSSNNLTNYCALGMYYSSLAYIGLNFTSQLLRKKK